MKNINRIFFCFLFLFLSSCATNFYIPNTQHVPLIDEKGQTSLTVAGNTEQGEFQIAYGVGESVALMSNVVVVFPQDNDNDNGGSGVLVDAGVGYYKPIQKNLLFDAYAIVGFGKFENHFPGTVVDFPSTTGDISANILRIGVQPSLSYHTDFFSITGSVRIASLSYLNIAGSLNLANIDQVNYLENNWSQFLVEPAITLRAGFKKAKFQFQYLHSFNIGNPNFPQTKDLITLGLNFQF